VRHYLRDQVDGALQPALRGRPQPAAAAPQLAGTWYTGGTRFKHCCPLLFLSSMSEHLVSVSSAGKVSEEVATVVRARIPSVGNELSTLMSSAKCAVRVVQALLQDAGLRQGVTDRTINGWYTGREPEAVATSEVREAVVANRS